MLHHRFFTLIILLFLNGALRLYAGLNLDASFESGFQTGVPTDDTGYVTENHAFATLDAAPSFTTDDSTVHAYHIETPLSFTRYVGGLYNVSVQPEITVTLTHQSGSSHIGLKTGYFYEPTTFDVATPEEYLEYGIYYERMYGEALSFGGKYLFTTVQEPGSGRFDFKNALSVSIRKQTGEGSIVSARVGGVWNVSTIEGAGYIQPFVSGRMVLLCDGKNLCITQLFAAYSMHEPQVLPTLIRTRHGNRGKEYDSLAYVFSEPKIPFLSLYCGFEHEFTTKLTPHFYYTMTLYGTGRSSEQYYSHQAGVMLFWQWSKKQL